MNTKEHVAKIKKLLAELKKVRSQIEKIEDAFGNLQSETEGELRGFCEEVCDSIGDAYKGIDEATDRDDQLDDITEGI